MASTGKPSRILIIVQNLPVPFDRRVWQEATTLKESGYDVVVICPKKGMYKKSYEVLEGIEIHRYRLIHEANEGIIGYLFEFAYCWLTTLYLSMRTYLRRPFQVIHACNPPDTYFLLALPFRLLGVKFIFDHHDLSPEMYLAKGKSKRSVLYKGLLLLERWTLRSAHHIIEVNESHKEIAMKRGRVTESKITVVRSGPRASWAEMKDADEALRKGTKHLVVYLGEMCAQDGVDYLLRAVKHFQETYKNDTHFALIGGGPDQERMQELAKELGLAEVTFTGRIPDEQLWTYLATADVCVDPDPWTKWSNMSTMNKIIEFMAFGCPIVAFDLLEHRRSAQDAAVYVTPNYEIEFAQAIRDLLDAPEKRMDMSRFGRQRFLSQLSWEHSEKALVAVYKDLRLAVPD